VRERLRAFFASIINHIAAILSTRNMIMNVFVGFVVTPKKINAYTKINGQRIMMYHLLFSMRYEFFGAFPSL
jgi:hypothetical protein